MTDVSKFYILSHIFISFIGAILLLVIWYNIRNRFKSLLEETDSQKRVDKGLLHLSFALFIWVLSGCFAYLGNIFSFAHTESYQLGVSFLSIANNMFLLLALFYFYYAPRFIYHNKKNITLIVIVIIVTSILTFSLSKFLGAHNTYRHIKISGIPDLLLSGFLCFLLGISLYRTFVFRGLRIVGMLSVLIIVLMFSSQLPDVFLNYGNDFTNNFIKIIAKTSLIALFLVLATTWVIRLANTPKPNEMTINFLDWGLVKISIPTKGVFNQIIDFESKTTQYRNLFKFALKRKFGDGGNAQSILVGLGGEITNQTYLTRILENINHILKLEENQKLERRDLFTFIGEGRYRLRMVPENITIDETLAEEFLKSPENQSLRETLSENTANYN